MKTSLVARLALTALVGAALGTTTVAQDQDARAPRPRAGAGAVQDGNVLRPRQRAGGPMDRLLRRSEPPRLGVSLEQGEDGLRVSSVEEGSPAQAAGVQVGDLLLRLDGQALDGVGDVRSTLAASRPGQTLPLVVVREGQGLVKLDVTLPEPEKAAQPAPQTQPDGHKGGFLGVELGEAGDKGVVVSNVLEGTAAWFAGLQGGDVLRAIDGHAIEGPEDVVGAVSSREPGSMVTLSYSREGKDLSATVRLGHRQSQAYGMLQPGGGLRFPQLFGNPDGNVMLLPGQGQGQGRFQLFGNDGQGWVFDGADVDWRQHVDGLDGWMRQLFQQLRDVDLQDGQDHSLRIRIDDGVMTIERDGDQKVIDLKDKDASQALQEALENVNLQVLPHGLMFHVPSVVAPGAVVAPRALALPLVQPDTTGHRVQVFQLGDGDCAQPCQRPDGQDVEAAQQGEIH